MDRALLLGILAAVLVLTWLWWDRGAASRSAEAELRRICFGDDDQVERLIAGELRRATGTMTRAEASRRAVERHRRDNR